jgi:hypothetical protein
LVGGGNDDDDDDDDDDDEEDEEASPSPYSSCRGVAYGSVLFLISLLVPTIAGEKGVGKSGKPLHFKGSNFHRIIPQFMLQGVCGRCVYVDMYV